MTVESSRPSIVNRVLSRATCPVLPLLVGALAMTTILPEFAGATQRRDPVTLDRTSPSVSPVNEITGRRERGMSDIFDVVTTPGQGLDIGGVGPNLHVSGSHFGVHHNDDNVLDISNGEDAASLTSPNPLIYFSVCRVTEGAEGSAVKDQSTKGHAAADRFEATALKSPLLAFNEGGQEGDPQTNQLSLNQTFYNLQPSISELQVNSTSAQDNVDSLEVTEFRFSGSAARTRSIYFTMDEESPTLDDYGWTTSDILVTGPSPDDTPALFTMGSTMGLGELDIIDGLAVWDMNGNGEVDIGDFALISLRKNSPFIVDGNLSGADIFITDFSGEDSLRLYLSYDQLGLLQSDEIDALDIVAVPEPASLGLIAATALMLGCRRRNR